MGNESSKGSEKRIGFSKKKSNSKKNAHLDIIEVIEASDIDTTLKSVASDVEPETKQNGVDAEKQNGDTTKVPPDREEGVQNTEDAGPGKDDASTIKTESTEEVNNTNSDLIQQNASNHSTNDLADDRANDIENSVTSKIDQGMSVTSNNTSGLQKTTDSDSESAAIGESKQDNNSQNIHENTSQDLNMQTNICDSSIVAKDSEMNNFETTNIVIGEANAVNAELISERNTLKVSEESRNIEKQEKECKGTVEDCKDTSYNVSDGRGEDTNNQSKKKMSKKESKKNKKSKLEKNQTSTESDPKEDEDKKLKSKKKEKIKGKTSKATTSVSNESNETSVETVSSQDFDSSHVPASSEVTKHETSEQKEDKKKQKKSKSKKDKRDKDKKKTDKGKSVSAADVKIEIKISTDDKKEERRRSIFEEDIVIAVGGIDNCDGVSLSSLSSEKRMADRDINVTKTDTILSNELCTESSTTNSDIGLTDDSISSLLSLLDVSGSQQHAEIDIRRKEYSRQISQPVMTKSVQGHNDVARSRSFHAQDQAQNSFDINMRYECVNQAFCSSAADSHRNEIITRISPFGSKKDNFDSTKTIKHSFSRLMANTKRKVSKRKPKRTESLRSKATTNTSPGTSSTIVYM